MKVYKFFPDHRARFHFGERGRKINNLVSSDQLFSALYNCIILLYGNGDKASQATKTLMELTLSSLLPGIHVEDLRNHTSYEFFFLPRPLGPFKRKEDADVLSYKKAKKIAYVSLNAFYEITRTWQAEGKYFDFDLSELCIVGGKFAITKAEARTIALGDTEWQDVRLFTELVTPRVSVLRENNHSQDFYFWEESQVTVVARANYLWRPFLYFICRGDVSTEVLAVVRLMAEEGLGGERSCGMGMLGRVVEEDWDASKLAGEGEYYVNISSVLPTPDEVEKLIYYEFIDRAGFLYSMYGRSLRKKRVRLLSEGSVFSGKVIGRIIDVSPRGFRQHPVYLNGKAFLVPIGGE